MLHFSFIVPCLLPRENLVANCEGKIRKMPNVNKIKNAGHVLWRFAPHIFFVAPPNIYKYFDGRWGGKKKTKFWMGDTKVGLLISFFSSPLPLPFRCQLFWTL